MSLLQLAAMSQTNASDGWPEDACLYQPFEEEQILLDENAQCLAVQAYVNMCKLEVKVVPRKNAEFMAPSGKLPVLKCGKMIVSEPGSIISFLKQKGFILGQKLSERQKQDMVAYTSLVNNVFGPAESFVSWIDDTTYHQITSTRYGSAFDWPLNKILCWRKRKAVTRYLDSIGWKTGKTTMTKLEDDVKRCCFALSEKLGDSEYFFGDEPTELDALVFGHLFTILTTRLPDNRLAQTVRKFNSLISFCQNIDINYFGSSESDISR